MQRQLFLHHYLPSLYFSVLCFCAVFDYITSSLRPRVKLQAAAVVLVLAIWSFAYFSPLTYAGRWTKGRCEKAKWLKSWDFSW
jgi:dolichyl-phosphate-mannose-protein mannosyltransferase